MIISIVIVLEQDADWCTMTNPDCSDFYTQQSCKKHCSKSEGNLIFFNRSKVKPLNTFISLLALENDPEWCSKAKPSCSDSYTQESCKKYCRNWKEVKTVPKLVQKGRS